MKQLQIPGIGGGVLPGELIVDLFAGGGGASAGIEAALGRPPDIAINHDPAAIQMHEANHPATKHYCESVYDVDPMKATAGQPVGLLWLSPDCRHFSRAKGGAPVSPMVRGLAWIGLRWAKRVRPRVVHLENVPEFQTWGPLLPDGRPNPERAGETFRAFVREWKRYGYDIEWRVSIAANDGAPTTRKRLYLTARCDAEPIVWPVPTYGKLGKPKPWRTAAQCIEWDVPCPSIFSRKKPLATATCRRIARGIARYVLQGKPFIVQVAHGDHVARPGDRCTGLDSPIGAVTKTNNHALVAPVICRMGHGDKQWNGADEPLTTVTAQGNHHALVAAFLAKHNGGTTGQPLTEPLHTIAGHINKGLVAASMIQIGQRHGRGDQPLDVPMGTVMPTQRAALVAAFLVQYYSQGSQDQPLTEPMATVVTRARHGLVLVTIDGTDYALVDIGMRMLTPRELANAQGFPPDYVLTGTKAQQIARIGNSVCPPVAAALVAANIPRPKQVKRGAA